MGEFDEFEAIGAGRIVLADLWGAGRHADRGPWLHPPVKLSCIIVRQPAVFVHNGRLSAYILHGNEHDMDEFDRKILDSLQRDSATEPGRAGRKGGLSESQAVRRRQALEAAGMIRRYRADLDPARWASRSPPSST